MLHQRLAMPALGATYDLGMAAQQIARRVLLEAKELAMLAWLTDEGINFAAETEVGERRREDAMHAQHPGATGMPEGACGQAKAIGQFVVVDERCAAGGAADPREIGQAWIGKADSSGLKVPETHCRLRPAIKAE